MEVLVLSRCRFMCCAVLLIVTPLLSATNIWNGNGTWDTMGNWSLPHIPGTGGWVGEDVQIASGTVTLNVDAGV